MMLRKMVGVMLVVLAAVAAGKAPAAKPFVMPSYRMDVGQKLCYTTTSESKAAYGVSGRTRQWEFYVMGWGEGQAGTRSESPGRDSVMSQSGIPTWRLLMKTSDASYRTNSAGKRTDYPLSTNWAQFELARSVMNLKSSSDANPVTLFPPLPTDTLKAKAGWMVPTDSSLREVDYIRVDNKTLSDSIWMFRMNSSSPLDSVYNKSSSGYMQLDTRRGLPVRREVEGYSDAGMGVSRLTGVTTLDSVVKFDPALMVPFARDLGAWFDVKAAYDSFTEAAGERDDTTAATWAEATGLLTAGKSKVSDSTVVAMFDDEIASLKEYLPTMRAETKARLSLIGKPAPAWTLPDLGGAKHSLKDFAGKVVVLDFWYRACPWCMRAMPDLNELAQKHARRHVEIIGMNTDESLADARYVVDKLRISYLNLRCGDVYKQYGVSGFPTVIVVNPQGKIADVLVGFSPDLRRKLERSIRRAFGED